MKQPIWIGATTDDGIDSPGFRCLLKSVVKQGWHIEAASPALGLSSQGTAAEQLTTTRQQKVNCVGALPIDVFDLSPAAVVRQLCVRAARAEQSNSRVCIVVGVNHGPNVGDNLIHSGTFCCALIASWFGFHSVSVSLDDVYSVDKSDPSPLRFSDAACVATRAIYWVLQRRRPVLCHINNVPNLQVDHITAEAASPHALAIDRQGLTSDIAILSKGRASVTVFPRASLVASKSMSELAARFLSVPSRFRKPI